MNKKEIKLISCHENLKRHRLKIALVYPNSYHTAMSNLGFHCILELLCRRNEFFIERIYFEDGKLQLTLLKNYNKLKTFDVILFSISFVNDIENAKKILQLLNIKSSSRSPWLIAGGMGVTIDPLKIADQVDYIFRGEIEDAFDKIINSLIEFKEGCISLEQLNKKLNEIRGLSDKEHYLPDDISFIKDLKEPGHSIILTPETEFKNTFLIEITRSCPFYCKFCFIGHHGRFRTFPKSIIINKILGIRSLTNRVGLVGSDVLSHPDIIDIYRILIKNKFRVSFSSFRADKITEEFIKLYAENGNKSLTIAPETGSEKLKKVINKRIPNKKILQIAEWVARYKLKKLKLYLLIGLPEEEDDDIIQTICLVKEVKNIFLKYRKILGYMIKINLSINQFISYPDILLGSSQITESSVIKRRVNLFKKILLKQGNIKINFNNRPGIF